MMGTQESYLNPFLHPLDIDSHLFLLLWHQARVDSCREVVTGEEEVPPLNGLHKAGHVRQALQIYSK